MSQKERIKRLLTDMIPYGYILGSFFLLDCWLRVMTRWIGQYSIFEIEPNLLSVFWCLLLTALVTLPKRRKAGRILYGIAYCFYLLYAVVQYGAWLVLGRFLWTSDFLNAGEGADFASWVAGFVTPGMILQILLLFAVGVAGILFFPKARLQNRCREWMARGITAGVCLLGILLVPKCYRATPLTAGTFRDPVLEYARFSNANYDLELTGMYHFLSRDIQKQMSRVLFAGKKDTTQIDAFFSEKPSHATNEMTGIFAGKNLLVIQMETVDDWMITPEDMPTVYRMTREGIHFTEFYTPSYASGYTFNTEFAFNIGVYPYSNGNVTYSLIRNTFDCSVANMFSKAGYSVNSYHSGADAFYNRVEIHKTLGYEKYHSYLHYPQISIPAGDDCFLTQNDALCADVTKDRPFFSFVITVSAHLPFTDENEMSRYALEKYPQYDVQEDREVNILRAKARMTDDMFAQLLERLERDGLLKDTVIVGYGDHYAYGLSDQERLRQLSEEAGSPILERTPAFIYCADWEKPLIVDKVTQITDLAPTVFNLFGMDVPKQIMGQDVFDPGYAGFVVFPGGTWLTKQAYVKNGIIQWNDGMTPEEIANMNAYVQQVYTVNDAILDSDYYRHK